MAGALDPKAEAASTGRNIILLSDGTGNSAGKRNKTNVWRLYQALDLSNSRQIALYDDGVGTSGIKLLQLLGGAFGWGLSRNVRDLYRFLCQHYQPGDHIYIFGFSRGAFTARTVADLIGKCGILDPAKAVRRSGRDIQFGTDEGLGAGIKLAYQSYRRSYHAHVADFVRYIRDLIFEPIPEPEEFRCSFSLKKPTKIEFVGVWDTVDAVGLPIDELSTMIDRIFYPHRFPNQDLSEEVKRACHAIAIDDERQTFHPVLWNEAKESERVDQGKVDKDRIKQVWFTGMHSNVGGGYPDDGLACVSLQWMIDEVKRKGRGKGLAFNKEKVTEIAHQAQPLGKMYDSRSGSGVYYRYKPRRIDQLSNDSDNGVCIAAPKIHRSVFDRIANDTASYAPTGIPSSYRVVHEAAPETTAEADERFELLERAQSHIFWRRFLYFMLLLVTLALLLLPYYLPPVPGRDPTNGLQVILGWLFGSISPFLPGSLTRWIDGWAQSAVWFSILVVLYVALMWHRRTIAANTQRLAEAAWWYVKHGEKGKDSREGIFEGMAKSLRHSTMMKRIHDWTVQFAMPWVALALIVFVAAGTGYRLFVHWPTVGGGVCSRWISEHPPKGDASTITFSEPLHFETTMPCLKTGLTLYEGQKYTIKFDEGNPWFDRDFTGNKRGLSHPLSRFHPVFVAATPMRRKLSYPWFALTGQIGLDPGYTFPIPDGEMTFRSQATGELYLYVNDAIDGPGFEIQGSSDWDAFYLNNRGTAQITVTPG